MIIVNKKIKNSDADERALWYGRCAIEKKLWHG